MRRKGVSSGRLASGPSAGLAPAGAVQPASEREISANPIPNTRISKKMGTSARTSSRWRMAGPAGKISTKTRRWRRGRASRRRADVASMASRPRSAPSSRNHVASRPSRRADVASMVSRPRTRRRGREFKWTRGQTDVLVAEAEERVERLLHEKAERGEHGHAAVRDLGLAEHLELGDGLALREARGVEVAHRRQRAGQARHEFRLVGGPALRAVARESRCRRGASTAYP